jgi:predicted methyltransferase
MAKLQVKTWVQTKKGNQFEIMLPAKRIVCPRCNGTGSHVNPAIDGNGLSADDLDQDPDFNEAYFRGDYDVRCEECKGENVVLELDYEALTPKMQERVCRAEREERAYQAELAMERRLGC